MPVSGHSLLVSYGFRGLPGALLGMGYVMSIVAGVYGLFFASIPPSVQALIGFTIVSFMWNTVLILAGLIGLLARWLKAPYTEIVAVDMIAGIMVTWSLAIFVSSSSNQAGFAFLMLAFLLFGWSAGTRKYLDERKRVLDSREE